MQIVWTMQERTITSVVLLFENVRLCKWQRLRSAGSSSDANVLYDPRSL
jgi:hypothetical protein